MSQIPEPTRTPAGLSYEGRLLDRPDEEVVDQGARFDLGTLISRRGMLGVIGVGLGGLALAACAPLGTADPATDSATDPIDTGTLPAGEIPDETAGPYPGDGSNGPDVLEQTGVVRSDIRSSIGGGATADGVPLTFRMAILDMANGDVPFAGVAVYAWHCDAQGRYSMYSSGVQNETYLRGVQVADANGIVSFDSVFPGCYSGRWPHIHFEVYPDAASIVDAGNAIATSQLALPEWACAQVYAESGYDGSARNLSGVTLADDNVFGEDGAALQLAATTGSVGEGYASSLVVRVDTRTAPTGGSLPGSRGPGAGVPGGGGPGDGGRPRP